MKIRFVVAIAGLAINFAPPAFAQQNDTIDPETAQQVRALASNYEAAFNRQDAATVAGLYAEDAVFNTPEGRFQGRQAIEELYAKNTTDRLTVHKSWTRRQCPIVRLAFFQRPKKRMRSWLAALKFNA
jgi:nuclear transport factor 2 (NTF2) superfamily protein